MKAAVTLDRYLASEERLNELSTSGLSELILQMAFAAKIVAREIRRAALVGKLGLVGERNPTGDAQKKLDLFANEVVIDAFGESGLVAAIASEELEELRTIDCGGDASYLLCADPLDGSSNTDVNGAVGTIFSFYRRSRTGTCAVEDELRHDAELLAAGYVLYGPSTMFVYSRGQGANGFTLDHDVGEFLLSHEAIRCPARGPYYSANLGRYHGWPANVQRFADHLIERDTASGRPYSLRYTGALVADLHRSLLEGGIYLYPADEAHPNGKLRLLYECTPLAFVAEQAGGRASSGRRRILELRPQSLHQTVPFAVGSREDVELYEKFAAPRGP